MSSEEPAMKIGMEPDPVEDFDREMERAIAAMVQAQVGRGGSVDEALRRVDRLAEQRLRMNREASCLAA
ncbi:hypothetical protein [Sphingomonas lenta]|nr:hypothetical protein [Sphingomonas lenta]